MHTFLYIKDMYMNKTKITFTFKTVSVALPFTARNSSSWNEQMSA